MTPSQYDALVRHFDRLCDADGGERAEAIAALRRDDPVLAERLAAMLSGDGASLSLLERAVRDAGGSTIGDDLADELLAQGHLVEDRYRIEERLGAGGGGRVYRATDTRDGATVALKLLKPDLAANRSALRRFEREFRALEGLDHPNCLRVLAQGREAGRPFIVMEYAAGGDLTRLIGADTSKLLPVLAQVVAGLDYVHSRRIIHRDLKPANVLLSDTDPVVAMLSDFGIALVEDDESTSLTRSGALLGTLDFLSP